MQREGGGELGSGSSGAGTTPAAHSAKSARCNALACSPRYATAQPISCSCSVPALDHRRLGDLGVLAFALVFGSFADEVSGDDDISLKESRCLFCTVNLYLTLPLVALLAILLVRFAALRPSLTANLFETIGALWLTDYLCPCRCDGRA